MGNQRRPSVSILNRQSTIGNRQSTIGNRQWTIANRQSAILTGGSSHFASRETLRKTQARCFSTSGQRESLLSMRPLTASSSAPTLMKKQIPATSNRRLRLSSREPAGGGPLLVFQSQKFWNRTGCRSGKKDSKLLRSASGWLLRHRGSCPQKETAEC